MKKNEYLGNANVISQKVPEMLKSSFYLSIPKRISRQNSRIVLVFVPLGFWSIGVS
jgi:hypothetical protein